MRTSGGRSCNHCAEKSPVLILLPVGRASSVPVRVGTAVLRTERMESLVGSMVAGSISRALRSPMTWTFLAEALTASAMMGRTTVSFMLAL